MYTEIVITAPTVSYHALLTLKHIVASPEMTVSGTLSSVNDDWFQAHQKVICFSPSLVYFADGGQTAALRHTVGGLKKQPNILSWRRSNADWLRWEILHNLRAVNEQHSSDLSFGIMTWHHYCVLPWPFCVWLLDVLWLCTHWHV